MLRSRPIHLPRLRHEREHSPFGDTDLSGVFGSQFSRMSGNNSGGGGSYGSGSPALFLSSDFANGPSGLIRIGM